MRYHGRHRRPVERARVRTVALVGALAAALPGLIGLSAASAGIAPGPGTVYGSVRTATGQPVGDAQVVVELLPSAGYPMTGQGYQAMQLTTGRTDSLGGFVLNLVHDRRVDAEAHFHSGRVNLLISAIQQVPADPVPGTIRLVNDTISQTCATASQVVPQCDLSPYTDRVQRPIHDAQDTMAALGGITGPAGQDTTDRVLIGVGAFTAHMKEQDGGTAAVIQPVNIGVLTVEDTTALVGVSGIAETPPEDTSSADTGSGPGLYDTNNGSAPGSGDLTVVPPGVSSPDANPPAVESAASTAPIFDAIPIIAPANDPSGGNKPDDRCLKGKNRGTWIVDVEDRDERLEPVGEVHTSTDEKVSYTYTQKAASTIGIGVKYDGGHWNVSGSVEMGNTSSGATSLPKMGGSFSRQVMGEFGFIKEHKTWCPQNYDGVNSKASHVDIVRALAWTGAVRYDSRDRSQFDQKDDYDSAKDDHRVGDFQPNSDFVKNTGKTLKFSVGVEAFGVGLTAVSKNDVNHKMSLKTGTTRQHYHLFGDVAYPADAANHAVYAYY
jgi:hypothetical protein